MAAIFLLVTNLALGAVLMHQSREAMKTLIDERHHRPGQPGAAR